MENALISNIDFRYYFIWSKILPNVDHLNYTLQGGWFGTSRAVASFQSIEYVQIKLGNDLTS